MPDETPNPERSEDVEPSGARPAEEVEARRRQDGDSAEDVEGHARPFVDPPPPARR